MLLPPFFFLPGTQPCLFFAKFCSLTDIYLHTGATRITILTAEEAAQIQSTF